jgi:hypothetical protein
MRKCLMLTIVIRKDVSHRKDFTILDSARSTQTSEVNRLGQILTVGSRLSNSRVVDVLVGTIERCR